MAHSSNIISTIKLPDGTSYEIHDSQAIHSAEELGLSAALKFKGTQTTEAAILGLTSASVGDVWLCTANNAEYVCVTAVSGTADSSAWEKLGDVHDAASSTHTHTVTVAGTNASSTVTGSVTVPTVSSTQKYLSASNAAPTVTKSTDSVLGADTTFTVSGGAATTSKMVTTSINNPSVTAVSIPNVTANTSVTASKVSSTGSKTAGTAASWGASVSDGVLSFSWTANTPTAVTLPTFTNVTATNTTLGTALSASKVTTSSTTVATGSLASTGTGASVATGVGAISVAASGDNVTALTAVSVAAPAITLTNNASNITGSVPVVSGVTVGSTTASVSGTAAAQKWTQSSGSTSTPK